MFIRPIDSNSEIKDSRFKPYIERTFQPNLIKDNAEWKIREMLKAEDVDESQIDNLIQKLKNGEAWDSFNPKYKDLKPQIDTPNYKKQYVQMAQLS